MSSIINADTSDGLKFTSDTSGEIKLQSAGADTVTVDTSGNVGIGTTSPSAKLSVTAGSSNLDLGLLATVSSKIEQTTGDLRIRVSSSNSDNYLDSNRNIIFGTSASYTERMRIDSGGGVFIGKTTTAETTAGWYFSPGAGNVGLSSGNYVVINYVPGGASTMIDFRTGGVSKGSISQNGTNVAYNTSSDYRLKENVSPMSGSIDRLKQLKPSTWSWTQDGSHGEGFLAHEAQTVVPEAVTGTKDAMKTEEYEVTPAVLDDDGNVVTEAVMGTREVPDYQGIDQSKLVPLLTAALQEAITKIEDLETRIQALENA